MTLRNQFLSSRDKGLDKIGRGYQVKNQGANELDFWLYEEIGYEGWDGSGITAKGIAKDLQAAGSFHTINLHINSPGGRVFEAVAIYNLFRMHKANVNVFIDGLAASSASIVAMCGNHIEMANNAMLMIHKPWTICIGGADDLRRDAEMLDKLEEGAIIQTYLNQCQKRGVKDMSGQLAEMMAAETWLSADDAYDCGLIDSIGEALAAAAMFDLTKFKFRNAPVRLLKSQITDIHVKLAAMNMESLKMRLDRERRIIS